MFVARSLVRSGIMSASGAVIQRLEQRAQLADEIILRLQQQVQQLRRTVVGQEEQRLTKENAALKQEVAQLKTRLVDVEIKNGVKQISVPASGERASTVAASTPPSSQPPAPTPTPAPAQSAKNGDGAAKKQQGKKEKRDKPKKEGKKDDAKQTPPEEVSIANLDLRIGKIVGVKKHPDADSLYVEEVELGEAQPRTVVSGLVRHIPIEEMQDRMVVLCCNLKPAKMRGILSQAMVMCASSPDKVEILAPPPGAVPGDRVSCDGFELGDYPGQMNPKRKIFERIQPDLTTNGQLQATYKGALWKVEGKGHIVASSMANSGIK